MCYIGMVKPILMALIYHHKAEIQERYIVELAIHDVGKSDKYPEGIKYGLICYDKKTSMKVLMDNHHPKGHHIHVDDCELEYSFSSDSKLLEDFSKLVLDNMGIKL